MKRRFISPLCSAIIIPGLGQIINHQIKKGIILLGSIFLLFIAGIVKLAVMINALLTSHPEKSVGPESISETLLVENFSILHIILIAFLLIWLYSIVDAFLIGRIIDKNSESDIL